MISKDIFINKFYDKYFVKLFLYKIYNNNII